MSRTSKLMKNTAIIAVGNICTKCISFFMLPLYTSILSTSEYGTIDLISVSVTLLVIVLTLQFEQGIFRYLIEARDNLIKQKEYITTTILALGALNLCFIVLSIPVLNIVKYQYSYYLIINVIFAVINAIILQLPRGLGDNVTYAVGCCINGSIHVILNVIFIAVLHWGIEGILLSTIISLLLSAVFTAFRMRLWKYISIRLISKDAFRNLITYSIPLVPNTLCWWVVNASDRVIIKLFIGIAANGVYSVAYKFPSLFSMISNIFQLSWTESAAENLKEANRDEYYQAVMYRSIRFYSSSNIGIIAVMPLVFNTLIKQDFVKAYNYIPILMTAALFHSVANLYGSIYTAFKMTKQIAKTTILAAFLNIVISVAFVKLIGMYAAALSSLIAYATITIIRHIDLKKYVKITISRYYIIAECLIYFLVFTGYYFKKIWIQILVMIILIPYCIIQNKNLLIDIWNAVKRRKRH